MVLINNLLSFFYSSSGSSSYFVKYVTSYECGFSFFGAQLSKFSMGFLILLVFFVFLDVEVVLLLKASEMFTLWGSTIYYLIFLNLYLWFSCLSSHTVLYLLSTSSLLYYLMM